MLVEDSNKKGKRMNTEPKLLIFASGSKTGGGTGFEKLVEARDAGILDAEIVAVVSQHENGGVAGRAKRLGIKFIHFAGPYTADEYQKIVHETGAEFVSLSGWLKLVAGLNPRTTINIHPGLLPDFGGAGMYGHHVHDAVMKAYKEGRVAHSGVSMHFVTEKYDEGPVFFEARVPILSTDTAETLGARVNETEHAFQAKITNKVMHGEIGWDGIDPSTLFGVIKIGS
jgi:phosphoribosylglycinamide formyltransferase-1